MKASLKSLLIILVAVSLIGTVLWIVTNRHHLQWDTIWEYRRVFLLGWRNTILLSIASLALSLLFGLITAFAKRSSLTALSVTAKAYIEVIRGTPLLVQILFFYYVIAHSIGLENRYVAGVTVLSLFHGAYIAEMVRAGIDNVSSTQLESARAIGLTSFQCYRFVILPQAARQVLPPLAGQFASIIKDSSLLSIIGINELTNSAQQINSATYSTLEVFFPLAIAYLILTLPISLWTKKLEQKFQYET